MCFPVEVHDILPNFGNFLYYFVGKGSVFLTIQLLFFQLEVTFKFSSSLQTLTVLWVFSEGFAGPDNYR